MITNESLKIGSEPTVQPFAEELPPLKHSGLGMASFVISIAQSIGTFVIFVAAGITGAGAEKSGKNTEVAFMVIGFLIIGAIFIHLVGLALGIAGAVQKQRKKLFAVLGLVFNALAVIFIALLMTIGILAGGGQMK